MNALPLSAPRARRIELDARDLDVAFPYHFFVDRNLEITATGRVLSLLLPACRGRRRFRDTFRVSEPHALTSFSEMVALRDWAVRLHPMADDRLVLEGHFLPSDDPDELVFLGSPDLTSVDVERTNVLQRANEALKRTTEDHARALMKLAQAKARLEEEVANRARIEGELRLAQRLEAVGQLAAGIAHEINTPVQYVADSIFFLKDAAHDVIPLLTQLRAGGTPAEIDAAWEAADATFLVEQVPRALERMTEGLERVASIVRAMKAFAHPGGDAPQPEAINDALETTLVVSRNEFKYIADVVTEYGDVPPVPCRLGEMNQVFLNLIVNASHAMADVNAKDGRRGTLTIRTRRDADDVVVEIADTGGGIPHDIGDRVFDPFFTTKPVGKGTGQGLAIARNIVVKHGGSLTYTTEIGVGTTFTIRLPLTTSGTHGANEPNPVR